MESGSNLTNHFLIAMPGLDDLNFHHTVTYVCEHSAQGAMGIVLNRPTDLHLEDILEELDIDPADGEAGGETIFLGGPVQTDRGFVLHSTERSWDSTLEITDGIAVTTSRDILEAIAAGNGPQEFLIALGYAGWGEGQLENELCANTWLSGPADKTIIFDLPPEQRWEAAASLLGVDLNLIAGSPGHA